MATKPAQTQVHPETDREKIARIIDPIVFTERERYVTEGGPFVFPEAAQQAADYQYVADIKSAYARADAVIAALPLLPSLQEWRGIESAPEHPLQVEFYYGKMPMLDQNGALVEPPPYRDERRELGFWDGEDWYHCGTGHRVNEFGDERPEFLPTHWRPLPTPPSI